MSANLSRARYRLRRLYRTVLVNVMDAIRWTGLVGHAHWCCMSRHSPCAKAGGCSSSCNCNARRAKWPEDDGSVFCCLDTDVYCENCAKGVHELCAACMYDSEVAATPAAADGQTSDH